MTTSRNKRNKTVSTPRRGPLPQSASLASPLSERKVVLIAWSDNPEYSWTEEGLVLVTGPLVGVSGWDAVGPCNELFHQRFATAPKHFAMLEHRANLGWGVVFGVQWDGMYDALEIFGSDWPTRPAEAWIIEVVEKHLSQRQSNKPHFYTITY